MTSEIMQPKLLPSYSAGCCYVAEIIDPIVHVKRTKHNAETSNLLNFIL